PPALASLGQTEGARRMAADYARLGRPFTRATHDSVSQPLPWLIGVTVVLLAALAWLSPGFKRLSAPGWLLLFAGVPWALFFWALGQSPPATTPGDDPGGPSIIVDALRPTLLEAGRPYNILLTVGILLVAVSVAGRVVWWTVQKVRRRSVAQAVE
ncbi:MAG TPA: hypothetical protein VD902_13350, partial [Symbiobacteriaceae bacterium]|nr:hypothetical protein [Symbiobacteriaceae bacterium]